MEMTSSTPIPVLFMDILQFHLGTVFVQKFDSFLHITIEIYSIKFLSRMEYLACVGLVVQITCPKCELYL